MKRAGSNSAKAGRKGTGGLTSDEGPNRNDGPWPFCSPCGYPPTGGARERREEESRGPGESGLLEAILDTSNVSEAWKRVRANKGSPGVDGVSVEDFPALFRAAWPRIRARLLDGTYVPAPALRVEIDKPDGGKRLLGVPTVLDRVIQQAMVRALGPIFDPGFSESSFGFRPRRSARQAVEQVAGFVKSGRRVAVDLDLSRFFDRVDHDILMERVARKVRDKRVLSLIGKYLRAGVEVDGRLQRTVEGVPQGGPLSPLLANIVLDDLDKELERRGHRFARYADDFVVLVKSQRAGERVMASLRRFLEGRLKLKVNESKSKVVKTAELAFLGFGFKASGRIVCTGKTLQAFRLRLRELTSRNWGVSMPSRLARLATYMRGWMGFFGIAKEYKLFRALDSWIRRRLRCCYWKQWKTRRNRIRNLVKLGASLRDAIDNAIVSHGPWRMSKTPVVNDALSNGWLDKQGLLSLAKLWSNIHYPATAR